VSTIYADRIRTQSKERIEVDNKITFNKDVKFVEGGYVTIDSNTKQLRIQRDPSGWFSGVMNLFPTVLNDGRGMIIASYMEDSWIVFGNTNAGNTYFRIGIDGSDSNRFIISPLDGSVNNIRLSTTGDFALQSGVEVNSILDEDDLSSDSATALATQQSIKKYVDDTVYSGLGALDDTTKIYAKVITGTILDGNATVSIAHGIANAFTNELILGISANMVGGAEINQVGGTGQGEPTETYFDNTNVIIERTSTAGQYSVYVLVIYK